MISIERLRTRLAAGLAQGVPYTNPFKAGFIDLWRHVDIVFLTWEEYALVDARRLRNERREFASVEEALDWLAGQGLDPSFFGP